VVLILPIQVTLLHDFCRGVIPSGEVLGVRETLALDFG
jgi:hypothetical protein